MWSAAYCNHISKFFILLLDYWMKITGYYHSANVVTFGKIQSDHIKWLLIYIDSSIIFHKGFDWNSSLKKDVS